MKKVKILLILMISILGLGAGISKVLLLPEELEFYSKVGLNESMLIFFGIVQLISTILFIFYKTRNIGALALALTFVISSIMIFLLGEFGFGLFSLLPIALIIITLKMK